MEMNIPVGEIDTLSRVMSFVAALAGLGWAFMGIHLNISRRAALYFCVANCLVVSGDVAAQFRGSGVSLIDYYQTFNLSYFAILCSVFLFGPGMQELHGQPCTSKRDLGQVAIAFVVILMLGQGMGIHNPAIAAVMLLSGCMAFLGFLRSYLQLRKNWSRKMTLALLWPFAVMGILFLMRFVDDLLTMGRPIDPLTDTMRVKHLTAGLWAQLLVFLLVNASLAGQTLNALFKKLEDQAVRLQHILDTAPVGVAVATDVLFHPVQPGAASERRTAL